METVILAILENLGVVAGVLENGNDESGVRCASIWIAHDNAIGPCADGSVCVAHITGESILPVNHF